jgi:Putative Actinobacterial Holin-X, holin superfamily III
MLDSLKAAIRSDIDRQIGWARGEVRRQTRHTALIGSLAAAAALATLGAITVGLIALYFWLSVQLGPFPALGIIGAGLLLVAVILFAPVFAWKRPRPALRPRLQIVQPAALIGTLARGNDTRDIAPREDTLKLLTDPVRHSPPTTLLGVLLIAAVVGMVTGRRL